MTTDNKAEKAREGIRRTIEGFKKRAEKAKDDKVDSRVRRSTDNKVDKVTNALGDIYDDLKDGVNRLVWNVESDEAWLESKIKDGLRDHVWDSTEKEATAEKIIKDLLFNRQDDADIKAELARQGIRMTIDTFTKIAEEREQRARDQANAVGVPPGVPPTPPGITPIEWLTNPLLVGLRAITEDISGRLENFIANAFGIERKG